jgi:hypothetical protein
LNDEGGIHRLRQSEQLPVILASHEHALIVGQSPVAFRDHCDPAVELE